MSEAAAETISAKMWGEMGPMMTLTTDTDQADPLKAAVTGSLGHAGDVRVTE